MKPALPQVGFAGLVLLQFLEFASFPKRFQPDMMQHRLCQLAQAFLLTDSQITDERFLVFINDTWMG